MLMIRCAAVAAVLLCSEAFGQDLELKGLKPGVPQSDVAKRFPALNCPARPTGERRLPLHSHRHAEYSRVKHARRRAGHGLAFSIRRWAPGPCEYQPTP